MNREKYLIWLGIAAAAGAAAGVLLDKKHPEKSGVLGAVAGVVSGAAAAGVYHYITAGDFVPYYSNSSSLYEETDAI